MFSNADPLGESREVADGIIALNAAFWGFPNVVYLVRSGAKWALIDTGIAETPGAAIFPYLDRFGGPSSLDVVLGTHGHVDHIGGNGAVKEYAPNARFMVGRRDARWTESHDHHYTELYMCGSPDHWEPGSEVETLIRSGLGTAAPVDRLLDEEESIVFGDGRTISAQRLGGHSPGQTLYVDEESATAFTGDAIQLGGIMNETTKKRDFPMYRSVADYYASLEMIERSPAERYCTAHAGTYEGSARFEVLSRARDWTASFHKLLKSAAEGLRKFTLEQIVDRVLDEWPEYANSLQIRVTSAEHLDDLVNEQHLTPHMSDGVKTWVWN